MAGDWTPKKKDDFIVKDPSLASFAQELVEWLQAPGQILILRTDHLSSIFRYCFAKESISDIAFIRRVMTEVCSQIKWASFHNDVNTPHGRRAISEGLLSCAAKLENCEDMVKASSELALGVDEALQMAFESFDDNNHVFGAINALSLLTAWRNAMQKLTEGMFAEAPPGFKEKTPNEAKVAVRYLIELHGVLLAEHKKERALKAGKGDKHWYPASYVDDRARRFAHHALG